VSLYSAFHRIIKSSAEYARICYDNTSTPNAMCQQYSSPYLEPKVNFTAMCPFTEELCLGDAVHIDTGYIDSHEDLGINGQPSVRIQFRKRQLAPPLMSREDSHQTGQYFQDHYQTKQYENISSARSETRAIRTHCRLMLRQLNTTFFFSVPRSVSKLAASTQALITLGLPPSSPSSPEQPEQPE
jgi:hypothetical protein